MKSRIRNKLANQRAFSLIQLMIVVVILIILSAIAMVLYSNYVTRTLISDRLYGLGAVKAAVADDINNGITDFSNITTPEGVKIDSDGAIEATVPGSSYTVTLKPIES